MNYELQDMMEVVGLQNYNWNWEKRNTSQSCLQNRFELCIMSVTCQKVNKWLQRNYFSLILNCVNVGEVIAKWMQIVHLVTGKLFNSERNI